jgi:uncharacterized protein YndB with AHSA1/START domain
MPPITRYRVRIWRPVSLDPAPHADADAAAIAAACGDGQRAATVEVDDGHGPVLVLAIGDGDVHRTDHTLTDYDAGRLVVRTWELEGDGHEVGVADLPENLLSEFHQALYEDGIGEMRLLTAEEPGPDGRSFIRAASWYEPAEYEAMLREVDETDD